jgi:hypothetical protein
MTAMDIKSLTSKKISGIPVIYIILVVVAIALFGAIKLKPSKPADAAGDTAEPDTAGDLPDTSQPVFGATPTITQPTGTTGATVTSTPMADTDTLWSRRAIDYLRQNGYTLEIATSAITKYVNGQPLTTVETGARDKAVQQFGLPPETIPDTSTIPDTPTPDPVPTPPDPTDLPTTPNYNGPASKQGVPPLTHTVKGTSDDTIGEIATLYFGSKDGIVNLVGSYNPQWGHYQGLPPGTGVVVPAYVEPKYYVATSATYTAAAIAQKNGTTRDRVIHLNPDKNFPVKPGVRVRVR